MPPKVMVWNDETEQFEEATQEEAECILEVIDDLNANCVEQKRKEFEEDSKQNLLIE